MKKRNIKKIKKVSKKIINKISSKLAKEFIHEFRSENEPHVKSSESRLINNYDEKVSLKFKKMVLGIINYPENIRLGYSDNSINIDIGDITSLKSTKIKNNTYNTPVDSNSHLNINIYKDHFNLTKGYSISSYYNDDKMYNDLIDVVKLKVSEINRNNFESICDDISITSGILRDTNLDDILQ